MYKTYVVLSSALKGQAHLIFKNLYNELIIKIEFLNDCLKNYDYYFYRQFSNFFVIPIRGSDFKEFSLQNWLEASIFLEDLDSDIKKTGMNLSRFFLSVINITLFFFGCHNRFRWRFYTCSNSSSDKAKNAADCESLWEVPHIA